MVDLNINYFNTGTATISNGGTVVTFQGFADLFSAVQPGDKFGAHVGDGIRILSMNPAANQVTLAYPWRGPGQTVAAYEISIIDREIGYNRAVEQLIREIGQGNLPLLAALTAAADKLPYFNSGSSMAVADFTSLGRALLASTSQTALWTAAGLSDGYVSLAGAGQTIASAKTFTGAVTLNNGPGRLVLPGLPGYPDLRMEYSAAGNVGFYDLTNGRWTLQVRADRKLVMFNLPHLTGSDGGDGWIRLNNQWDSVDGPESGSIRLYGTGMFGYAHNNIPRVEITPVGNMIVTGSLTAASKSFLIDHPLDPFNKDLVFAATESPGLFVEFSGRSQLVDGRAVVDIDEAAGMMPGTWDALATDNMIKSLVNETSFARLRPGPVENGTFEIICEDSESTDTVVWTVIGRRRDPFVMDPDNPQTDGDGRLIVEPEKPDYDPAMEDEAHAD